MQDFILPVAALPQWELSVKVAQLLSLRGPWWHQVCRDTDCLHRRSYGPIRVFFRVSCSWRSDGLFDQSFSIVPPVQAHRRAPLAGVLLCRSSVRHWKENPGWVLLCGSLCQGFDGPASLLFSCWCLCGEKKAMMMAPPPIWDSTILPCFHGCLAFFHQHFPPWSPPSHPLNPSLSSQQQPSPGIAPQSLNSSSQQLHLPGDQHSCPGYVYLWQGVSDSHSI